jgi:hypothetical protein
LKFIEELISTFDDFQDPYLTDEKNLVRMMKLMVSTYKNISRVEFHIFKLFVAKEEKPEPILKNFKNNNEKLIQFLNDLLDGVDDEDIQQDREFLLSGLGALRTS